MSDPRFYEAHGAALELWRDRSPETILSGPAGTGKSRACLEKLNACCLKWPGSRWLIVRKTRESLTESALVTFEDKVLPEGSPIAAGPQRRMRQAYRYPNGSEVVVGGLDKPSKVMSTEYDGIYVQEAIELYENDWESLTTRLRNGVMPFHQMIADTNPDAPSHWLKQREGSGRARMIESRHRDNPVIWDFANDRPTEVGRVYLAKLDNLTGVRRDRLYLGKWVQAEGVVYEEWDRAVHLIDAMPPGWQQWRKIRSVDFGYTNPFVCQWFAIDPDERLYLYREIYRTQTLVSDHARRINSLSAGEYVEATVADHDAEDRATLASEGIDTDPASKAITVGIQAVQDRLRPAGDGRPRLFVLRDCLAHTPDPALAESRKPACTADEFEVYSWPEGKDGRPVKEVPADRDNHGMDALRYACMYLDDAGHTGAWGANPFAELR